MHTLLGIFNLLIGLGLVAYGVKNLLVGHYFLALIDFTIAIGNLFFAWLTIINLIDRNAR